MAVACGDRHTLTLDDNGEVWSFGNNNKGQCGHACTGPIMNFIGSLLPRHHKTLNCSPKKVSGIANIIQISCGSDFSVCVDVNGCIWTFGNNQNGQLGLGDTTNRKTPQIVPDIDNIASISCGYEHTMALTHTNDVYGFGSNFCRQLGLEPEFRVIVIPRHILISDKITQLACGGMYTICITSNGEYWACGYNYYGQLGFESDNNSCPLTKCDTPQNIVSVACGESHTIIMTAEKKLFSMGRNFKGQLCQSHAEGRNCPEPIKFRNGIHNFSCGDNHTIILDDCNQVWIFGMKLKESDAKRRSKYYRGYILTQSDIRVISSGGNHVLLKSTSEIWGIGKNGDSQLGLPKPSHYPFEIHWPTVLQEEHWNIIGTPLLGKSYQKSARK